MALTKVTEGIRTLGTDEVIATNIATDAVTTGKILDNNVTVAKIAGSAAAAADTFLKKDGTWAEASTDTTQIESDIALLGFKVAVAGSMGKYNLIDQTEDAFMDDTGIDASASTNEIRNAANYYSGGTTSSVTATGGATSVVGDYTFHYFTANGDFITDATQPIEVLLVAGGGGGGKHSGGGGAGGGVVYQASRTIAAGTHAFVMGLGGAGRHTGTYPSDPGGVGATGQDSTFNTLTAKGGGGGAGNGVAPGAGGSGGGSTRVLGSGGASNQSSQSGDSGTYGFGFAGGAGTHSGVPYPAAGGGGAGAVGGNTTASAAGAGGAGKYIASFAAFGVSGNFAGGGGGQVQDNGNYGAGGLGGGARGSNNASGNDGMGRNGLANTGGGGGGSQYNGAPSGNTASGGSGTLILKRSTIASFVSNLTLQSNATTAETTPTKGDIVMTYTTAGGGSTTVGTDLTAEVSADDGSTWTDMGLVAGDIQGTTGGHTIISKHNVTISSTITAPYKMRYRIKTLNQAAAKETRIQAVSLGWS